ncbi:hypothetical protein IWX49DRAFT_91630 [Phyllosticta citricarpa]|uniref:Secreted protein n=2 Tax=Phyllosticta TaxID=121621 RepID=A0ABR1LUX1_9PEZI
MRPMPSERVWETLLLLLLLLRAASCAYSKDHARTWPSPPSPVALLLHSVRLRSPDSARALSLSLARASLLLQPASPSAHTKSESLRRTSDRRCTALHTHHCFLQPNPKIPKRPPKQIISALVNWRYHDPFPTQHASMLDDRGRRHFSS